MTGSRIAFALIAVLGLACGNALATASAPIETQGRLLAGVGDRLRVEVGGQSVFLPSEARRMGLPADLFEIWLPRGFQASWVRRRDLERLRSAGTIPVMVHYFFGDGISRERVDAKRAAWHSSLRRMAHLIENAGPVLVVLEPEFNEAPPPGETALTAWPGFGDELVRAAAIVREIAPEARVGPCAGDFSPDRNLAAVLGPVATHFDFLAFQELRAKTDPDAGTQRGYLEVGRAAVDYARYLDRTFHRPVLLAYVGISSYGGWRKQQARALRGLIEQRENLRKAGVFGVVYFALRDDPEHVGYFGAAERSFGLSNARGRPKPALEAFRRLGNPGGDR